MISRPPIMSRHASSLRRSTINGAHAPSSPSSSFQPVCSSPIKGSVALVDPCLDNGKELEPDEIFEVKLAPKVLGPSHEIVTPGSTSVEDYAASLNHFSELPNLTQHGDAVVSSKSEHIHSPSRNSHEFHLNHIKTSCSVDSHFESPPCESNLHSQKSALGGSSESKPKGKNFSLFPTPRSDLLKDIKSKHHFGAHSIFKEHHSSLKNLKLSTSSNNTSKQTESKSESTSVANSFDVQNVNHESSVTEHTPESGLGMNDDSHAASHPRTMPICVANSGVLQSTSLPGSVVSSYVLMSGASDSPMSTSPSSSFDQHVFPIVSDMKDSVHSEEQQAVVKQFPCETSDQMTVSNHESQPLVLPQFTQFTSSSSFDASSTTTTQVSARRLLSRNSFDESALSLSKPTKKPIKSQRTFDIFSLKSHNSTEVISLQSQSTLDTTSFASQMTLDASLLPHGRPNDHNDATPASKILHPLQTEPSAAEPAPVKLRISSSSESEDEGWLLLNDGNKDTRAHVIGELYDTEKNYVKKLSFLIKRYEQALRGPEFCSIIDQSLVDDIFYQVPDILGHHERFLEEFRRRIEARESNMCVGDVIYNFVSDPAVLSSYTSFTKNWKTAQDATKAAAVAKPAFGEFLVSMAREHPGKMDLKALLISPVQRFPHYEMLLKRLQKHTPHDHPDYPLLLEALSKAQEVTVKINDHEKRALQQEHQQDILRDLEAVIEGLEGLAQPDRTFLQVDLATMHSALGSRKDRCLFLFSDILVIASVKRRTGALKKMSNCPVTVLSLAFLEVSKLKLFKFIALDDLEIARSRDEAVKKLLKEIENLEEDLQTVQRMVGFSRSLHSPRPCIEEALHEAETAVRKQLSERQGPDSILNEVELTITTQEGVENITFLFHNPEKRANWEEAFLGAKQKLAMSADRRPPPEFVNALPIRKTRAGLQFTCAASTATLSVQGLKDVWVCNSDGYVGQVCVLTLHPEPAVACCNGVCNARILSIASVAAAHNLAANEEQQTLSRPPSTMTLRNRVRSSRKRLPAADGGLEQLVERGLDSFKKFRSDVSRSAVNRDDSDSSDDDEEEENNTEESSRQRRSESLPPGNNLTSPSAGAAAGDDGDARRPTMWLGTEDGFIHVYNCSDTIRIKKNKFKFQLGSSVHCIIPLDNRVFASLASGEVVVFRRNEATWSAKVEREVVMVSSPAAPVIKMIMVAGKLWCATGNVIKILNTNTLQLEHSFLVSGGESSKAGGVTSLVAAGQGVWLSSQGSSIVRLYHATTHECLCEANVAPAVTKMLASSPSCDDIIRQHKLACLRVTSLLACKDVLWVGTSAGVVLTAPLPHLPHHQHHHHHPHPHWRPHHSSHHPASSALNLQAVPHGHTGQVRFLTYVELSPEARPPRPKAHGRYSASFKNKDSLQGGTVAPTKLLVISGGDGYEDFRNANVSELAGRDDSTNHLLMWHI